MFPAADVQAPAVRGRQTVYLGGSHSALSPGRIAGAPVEGSRLATLHIPADMKVVSILRSPASQKCTIRRGTAFLAVADPHPLERASMKRCNSAPISGPMSAVLADSNAARAIATACEVISEVVSQNSAEILMIALNRSPG